MARSGVPCSGFAAAKQAVASPMMTQSVLRKAQLDIQSGVKRPGLPKPLDWFGEFD